MRADDGRAVTGTTDNPRTSTAGDGSDAHLLGDGAHLLSRQVVKGENKPPVKVAFASQGPIMHIGLLLVLFKANHPTRQHFREHS